MRLSDLPGEVDRIDLHELLEEGGSVTLTYDPGQSGRRDELGDVIDKPIDPAVVATALSWDGAVIGSGSGTTIAEAMIWVYRRRAPFPDLGDTGVYSDEPRSDPRIEQHADVALERPVPLSTLRTGP